jgi:hypothetical protein
VWSTEAISKEFSASSLSGSAAASCVLGHLRHGCAAVASSGEQMEDKANVCFFLQPLFHLGNNIGYVIWWEEESVFLVD